MDEKTMVNDVLSNIKMMLSRYQNVIAETENIHIRQVFQQIRNNDESFQYELFKVAMANRYYTPVEQATQDEIKQVKNQFQ